MENRFEGTVRLTRSTGNLAMIKAMVGKRSSNAAGKHADRRGKRARTRGAAKARALRDFS